MRQLLSGLHAKTNNSHQQKNYGVHFLRGVSLQTLQLCPLDGLDLLFDQMKPLHVTTQRADRVGWQSYPLWGAYRIQFFPRFAQYGVEVTHAELDQDRFHPVAEACACMEQ